MQRRFLINAGLGAVALAAGVTSYAVVGAQGASTHTTETLSTAKTGIVLSSVTATGNVEAPSSLSLSFQQSGRVTEIDVAAGQHVDAGQVLARVDDSTERSALVTAQAQLASAEASLAVKLKGATPDALAQDAAGLSQSQLSVDNSVTGLAHAQQTAAANALKYQQAVDQATAQLAAGQQTAAANALKYQQAVDQATAQLAAAQQTAQGNVAKYQLAVDQANQQVTDANQQLSTANSNLANDRSSLQSMQSSYDPSASPSEDTNALLNRYRLDQANCQGTPPPKNSSDGVTCSEVANLISFAQNVASAETAQSQASTAVETAQRAVSDATLAQTNGLTQDQQAIGTAQRGRDAATLAQTNGTTNDQQAIGTAQRAVDAAKLNQSNGLMSDGQSIDTASNAIATAQAGFAATQAGNAVKEAPATPDVLASARASVASAQAALDTAQRNDDETALTAPVAGTVASLSGQVGSQSGSGGSSSSSSGSSSGSSGGSSSSSSASSGFVVLTDVSLLDVKVGFAESDATKVKIGQAATVTFDALPAQTVNGKVISLDVNQTLVSNVVTYYARVDLTNAPATVKPGMTASVAVVLDKRDSVITLPTSAVPARGTTGTVTVRASGKDTQRSIAIGLRGDNAVEIVSGLQAGDVVVTKTTSVTGAGTSTVGGGRGGGGGGGAGAGFVN
jgi:multidrug efflux pump subunit AcrA (membrane-fusion protein)